jgi:hypothetical protein
MAAMCQPELNHSHEAHATLSFYCGLLRIFPSTQPAPAPAPAAYNASTSAVRAPCKPRPPFQRRSFTCSSVIQTAQFFMPASTWYRRDLMCQNFASCFQLISPILPKPFRLPKLNASPWLLLRILMKPVTGPFSPSFSTLKFANASSPTTSQYIITQIDHHYHEEDLPNTLLAYKFALKN